MSTRSAELRAFLGAAEEAFTVRAEDERSQVSVSRGFAALAHAAEATPGAGSRLPVCDRHIDEATAHGFDSPDLRRLAAAFRSIEPALTWGRRQGPAPAASNNFAEGHANAMIVGPGGLLQCGEVWLGVSLLAPGVRYPDHTHPPEETYLVMSPGEFSQDDGPWFEPGPGGSFYNPPGVLHAMRSGSVPLFAFWLLTPEAAPNSGAC